MLSDFEAVSCLKLINFVHHSTLGLRVTKKILFLATPESRKWCIFSRPRVGAVVTFENNCPAQQIDFGQPLPRLWSSTLSTDKSRPKSGFLKVNSERIVNIRSMLTIFKGG